MQEDANDRLLRDVAASGMIHAIRPPSPEWENDPSFSLSKLPVDSTPWFGGIVRVKVPIPGSTRWTLARFVFWMADDDIVWIDAILQGSEATTIAYSLIEAAVRPITGDPRRPAKVFVGTEAMAAALRAPLPEADQNIASVVEIAVGPSPDNGEQVVAFLNMHAQLLAGGRVMG